MILYCNHGAHARVPKRDCIITMSHHMVPRRQSIVLETRHGVNLYTYFRLLRCAPPEGKRAAAGDDGHATMQHPDLGEFIVGVAGAAWDGSSWMISTNG